MRHKLVQKFFYSRQKRKIDKVQQVTPVTESGRNETKQKCFPKARIKTKINHLSLKAQGNPIHQNTNRETSTRTTYEKKSMARKLRDKTYDRLALRSESPEQGWIIRQPVVAADHLLKAAGSQWWWYETGSVLEGMPSYPIGDWKTAGSGQEWHVYLRQAHKFAVLESPLGQC